MMTTPPLDASLDVSRRLDHLRGWQTEWSRIDRLLAEQVSQLDGNKLLELQQASHIANVRRRMEMTLVKTPLSIPESVLLSLGVRRIRELLAQQFARLTQEERLLWLNQLLHFPDDHRPATTRRQNRQGENLSLAGTNAQFPAGGRIRDGQDDLPGLAHLQSSAGRRTGAQSCPHHWHPGS